jgi:hypothetical protein
VCIGCNISIPLLQIGPDAPGAEEFWAAGQLSSALETADRTKAPKAKETFRRIAEAHRYSVCGTGRTSKPIEPTSLSRVRQLNTVRNPRD